MSVNVTVSVEPGVAGLVDVHATGNQLLITGQWQVLFGSECRYLAYVTPDEARQVAAAWSTLADQLAEVAAWCALAGVS